MLDATLIVSTICPPRAELPDLVANCRPDVAAPCRDATQPVRECAGRIAHFVCPWIDPGHSSYRASPDPKCTVTESDCVCSTLRDLDSRTHSAAGRVEPVHVCRICGSLRDPDRACTDCDAAGRGCVVPRADRQGVFLHDNDLLGVELERGSETWQFCNPDRSISELEPARNRNRIDGSDQGAACEVELADDSRERDSPQSLASETRVDGRRNRCVAGRPARSLRDQGDRVRIGSGRTERWLRCSFSGRDDQDADRGNGCPACDCDNPRPLRPTHGSGGCVTGCE